jgi:hypothetical protein
VCWQKIESKYSDTGWRFKQVVHSLSHILHTALGLWVVYFFDLVYLLEVFRYTKRVHKEGPFAVLHGTCNSLFSLVATRLTACEILLM